MAKEQIDLKLKVDVPESKFKVGDVVEVPNTKNGDSVFIFISKVFYMGQFMFCPTCGSQYGYVKEIAYETIIQEGSILDSEEVVFERPGKVYRHSEPGMINSRVIENPTFKVVDADNALNIKQREVEWRTDISKIRKGTK